MSGIVVARELDVDDGPGHPRDAADGGLAARCSVSVSSLDDVAVMSSLTSGVRVGERVDAADDLADLLGDLGLAGLVGDAGVLHYQLVGVVGRRLHRALAGGELGRGRLQQAVVDAALRRTAAAARRAPPRRRLELVQRQQLAVRGRSSPSTTSSGSSRTSSGSWTSIDYEPGVDDVDLVDRRLSSSLDERRRSGRRRSPARPRRSACRRSRPLLARSAADGTV